MEQNIKWYQKLGRLFNLEIIISVIIGGIVLYSFWIITSLVFQLNAQTQANRNDIGKIADFINGQIQQAQKGIQQQSIEEKKK